MLVIPPPKYRKRRRPLETPAASAAPVALTLLSASYDSDALTLTLSFDRAIDASGIDGELIWVSDPVATGEMYAALGAWALLDPATVRVELSDQSGATGDAVTLSAYEGNGIVAAEGGMPWAGVSELGLPFP